MQKVEKTYRELLEISSKIQQISQAPYEGEDVQARVLMSRAYKNVTKALEEYEEAVETLRIKHCLKDKDTNKIVKNDKGQYEFDADGSIALIEAVKKLQQTKVELKVTVTLPYSELLKTLPAAAQPYWQWEDVEDVLAPIYENK